MTKDITSAGTALALTLPSAKLAAGATSDYYAFQRTEDDKLVTVLALALELGPKDMPASKDLCIYADVVTFSPGASLSMPGRNLTISARRIITNGVKLDVSGRTQQRFPQGTRAADGQPGQAGTNGTSGAPGQDAGAVTLIAEEFIGDVIVEAVGGEGERGQDGGYGGVGLAGDNGADAVIGGDAWYQNVARDPEPGKKGKAGGRGGNAGMSGAGGSGGRVTVISVKAAKTTISARGGNGGATANPGIGGLGGPGGLGGRNASCRTVGRPGDVSRYCELNNNRAPSGPAGDNGPYGAGMPLAKPGESPAPVVATTQDYLQCFFERTPAPPMEQRQLVLHQAELRYLNGEFDQAVTLLDWLVRVTPSASTPASAGRDMDSWRSIHERAISLLRQIRAGLNYYAKPENYVPLVSLSFYQKQLPTLLNIALVLEGAYKDYATQQSDQQAQTQALDTALKQVEAAQKTISKEVDQVRAKQLEVQDAIASLTLSVESQANAVLAASQQFKDALVVATGCENFMTMVSNIACIVKIGADTFGTFQAIRTAYNQFGGAAGDASLSNVIKELKPVSAKADSLAKSIRENIGKVKPLNTDAAPDAGKLGLTREEFDKMIQPWEKLPEAEPYKTIMYNYLDGVQARNEKVVEYNALLAKETSLQEQLRQGKLSATRAQDALSAKQNPAIPQFRTFMQGAYVSLKSTVLRYLFEENQAYGYWALDPRPFRASDQTIAQLQDFHGRLSSDVLDYLNGNSAPRQPFVDAEVRFTRDQLLEQFNTFLSGRALPGGGHEHSITLQIRLSQPAFARYSDVLAKSFTLELPGAKTNNDVLTARLLHSGRAVFRNRDGRQLEFSHLQIEESYEYDLKTGAWRSGGNLGDDEGQETQIIGLSPFTTWTISLRDSGNEESENPGLDLSQVNEIVFRFKGRCRLPK